MSTSSWRPRRRRRDPRVLRRDRVDDAPQRLQPPADGAPDLAPEHRGAARSLPRRRGARLRDRSASDRVRRCARHAAAACDLPCASLPPEALVGGGHLHAARDHGLSLAHRPDHARRHRHRLRDLPAAPDEARLAGTDPRARSHPFRRSRRDRDCVRLVLQDEPGRRSSTTRSAAAGCRRWGRRCTRSSRRTRSSARGSVRGSRRTSPGCRHRMRRSSTTAGWGSCSRRVSSAR